MSVTGSGQKIRNPSGGAPHQARAAFAYTTCAEDVETTLELDDPTIYQDPDGLFGSTTITFPFDCIVIGNVEVQVAQTECLAFVGGYFITDVTSAPELDDAVWWGANNEGVELTTVLNGEMNIVRRFSAGDTLEITFRGHLGQPTNVQPVIGLVYWLV